MFELLQRANEKSTKLIAEEKLAFTMSSGSRLDEVKAAGKRISKKLFKFMSLKFL